MRAFIGIPKGEFALCARGGDDVPFKVERLPTLVACSSSMWLKIKVDYMNIRYTRKDIKQENQEKIYDKH